LSDDELLDPHHPAGGLPTAVRVVLPGLGGHLVHARRNAPVLPRLLLHKPEAQFLFITPDNPRAIFEKAVLLGIPPGKIDVGRRSGKKYPLAGAEPVSPFLHQTLLFQKSFFAHQNGEVLAMGLPVICNAGVGDTDYIVEKYGVGAAVDAFTDAAFDAAIARMEGLSQLPPEHFRHAALDYFDLQKGVALYHSIYQKLA
jgi:hypothetical protein